MCYQLVSLGLFIGKRVVYQWLHTKGNVFGFLPVVVSIFKNFQVRLKLHEPFPFSLTKLLAGSVLWPSCIGDYSCWRAEECSCLISGNYVPTLHFQSHIPCASSWCPLSLGSIIHMSQGESITIMEGSVTADQQAWH